MQRLYETIILITYGVSLIHFSYLGYRSNFDWVLNGNTNIKIVFSSYTLYSEATRTIFIFQSNSWPSCAGNSKSSHTLYCEGGQLIRLMRTQCDIMIRMTSAQRKLGWPAY